MELAAGQVLGETLHDHRYQPPETTVDLKVQARDMRGDAFFVIGIDRKSPPGGQIYVDEISLKLVDR